MLNRDYDVDEQGRCELDAEQRRHELTLATIPGSDRQRFSAEFDRHLGRVTEIVDAALRRRAPTAAGLGSAASAVAWPARPAPPPRPA